MGKTSYLFNDYIKDLAAASISITSEDTTYPETNLQNENVALTTRTTAKTAIKFRFTLASAKALQAFFIGNHNFSGGTFDINSYSAADFVTGKATVETVTVQSLDVYHREASAPTARQYWEFDFTNCTSADSYFEIGRIMAYDDLVQITETEDFDAERQYGFKNIINETVSGVRWVHKLTERREQFGLRWGQRAGTTVIPELKTLFQAVYGDAHPFVFIPDLAAVGCYYVYILQPELTWAHLWRGTFVSDITLTLIEAIRGRA